MRFFIDLIKKIFRKDKIKYLYEPLELEENNNVKKDELNSFSENLILQADPDINYGNGYKIKKLRLKDMV